MTDSLTGGDGRSDHPFPTFIEPNTAKRADHAKDDVSMGPRTSENFQAVM